MPGQTQILKRLRQSQNIENIDNGSNSPAKKQKKSKTTEERRKYLNTYVLKSNTLQVVAASDVEISPEGRETFKGEEVIKRKDLYRQNETVKYFYSDNGERIIDRKVLKKIAAQDLKEVNGRKVIKQDAFNRREYYYLTGEKKGKKVDASNNHLIEFNNEDRQLHFDDQVVLHVPQKYLPKFKKKIKKELVEEEELKQKNEKQVASIPVESTELNHENILEAFIHDINNFAAQLQLISNNMQAKSPSLLLSQISYYLQQIQNECQQSEFYSSNYSLRLFAPENAEYKPSGISGNELEAMQRNIFGSK